MRNISADAARRDRLNLFIFRALFIIHRYFWELVTRHTATWRTVTHRESREKGNASHPTYHLYYSTSYFLPRAIRRRCDSGPTPMAADRREIGRDTCVDKKAVCPQEVLPQIRSIPPQKLPGTLEKTAGLHMPAPSCVFLFSRRNISHHVSPRA